MIKDIKSIFCTEEIYSIYSGCMYEPTFEKFNAKAVNYQNDSSVSLYGYFKNEKIVGIIATKEKGEQIEVLGISVDIKERYFGIGTRLIEYIRDTSTKPIIAETDSNAVMFYKKCGFDIEEKVVSKSNVSYNRYVCTLNYK
ncbi:MAG: GNAT family N-acetyltransferase [Clostridia bacterium]|nr:GNAT family N-acetyltransferase [Clostridia bacterium]